MNNRTVILAVLLGCGAEEATPPTPVEVVEGSCAITGATPASLPRIDCRLDFQALASEPLDTSIPGARSVKVVLDQSDDTLYFQDSQSYPIHYAFASAQLSGNGRPLVPSLAEFNQTEYFSPDRRFVLGAVTYYEGPQVWALEIAPYDTASATMITQLYRAVADHTWFGPLLVFHPTSTAVAAEAARLNGVPIRSTDDLYRGIDYQPLNLTSAMGRLRFINAVDLATQYVDFREIVVLDVVPNDISVVSGIITQEFQTPLSHINVLSRNRQTPNMGLKGATTNPELLALEGQWVELVVGASSWSISPVSREEADAFWEAHRPTPVQLQAVDPSVRDLVDIEDVTREGPSGLREAIKAAIPAFGGKAAHYSILAKTEGLPVRKAFAIPAYYYVDFMERNGFTEQVRAMLADPEFVDQPSVRDQRLAALRRAMGTATVSAELQVALRAKMNAEFPGQSLRFRTSTNSEDLDGFPCAGCYESHTGDPADWDDVLDAIRDSWASIWLFRTFEERSYNGIDHLAVVMALLVHRNFPAEEANGVAITANPFDSGGLQPGFFINVQFGGDVEVVHPPAGTTSDQIIYLYDQPGQPISYLSHSNVIPSGQTVLSTAQLYELGQALAAIHLRFSPAYGPAGGNTGWYAMDVEFKFDDEDSPGEVKLLVKQARPYPGQEP